MEKTKGQFYLFILILLHFYILPGTVADSYDNCELNEVCYDVDLDIQIGDVFTWSTTEATVNGSRSVDDDNRFLDRMEIKIKILKSIEGLSQATIKDSPEDYFKTTRTYLGSIEDVEGSDPTDLISPTINLTEIGPVNFYEQSLPRLPSTNSSSVGIDYNRTTIIKYDIDDEIFYASYAVEENPLTSDREYRKWEEETRRNIKSGLMVFRNATLVIGGTTHKTILEFKSHDRFEKDLDFQVNIVAMAILSIIIIVFSVIAIRIKQRRK